MKLFYKIKMAALVGLALCSASTYGQSGQPAQHKFSSFIAGYNPPTGKNPTIIAGQTVAVCLNTNQSSLLYTQTSTNVLVDTKNGYTNSYGTNGIIVFTQGQAGGFTYGTNEALIGMYITNVTAGPGAWLVPYIGPYAWYQGGQTTNIYGYNTFYKMWVSGTTNSLGGSIVDGGSAGFVDAPNFCDQNGNPASVTISASVCTDQPLGTNVVTLTFGKTYNGWSWDTNTVSMTIYCNGTNETMQTTNLTTSQETGGAKWRLQTVVCGTNNAPDLVFLTSCGLSGFAP